MSVLSQFYPGLANTYGSKIPLNILVQAGGGGGGAHLVGTVSKGGGGGAGGLGLTQSYRVSPGITCPIVVGSGGAAGAPSPTDGGLTSSSNGGHSGFFVPDGSASHIRLEGGGGGGATSTLPPVAIGKNGGCGGGKSTGPGGTTTSAIGYYTAAHSVRTLSAAPGTAPLEYVTNLDHTTTEWGVAHGTPGGIGVFAGNPNSSNSYVQLMGGSVGYLDTLAASGNRGDVADSSGRVSFITGTVATYGQGGGHTPTTTPIPASGYNAPNTANTGNGGNAGAFPSPIGPGGNFTATAGQSGVVVVQYPDAYPAAPAFPGASDVSPATPGFRTYRFTSSGSITLP